MVPSGRTGPTTSPWSYTHLPVPDIVSLSRCPSSLTELPLIAHDLVGPPTEDFTDDFMDAQYVYRFPPCVPSCSLRVGTLNVNGALYHPEYSTIDTLSHLFSAAKLSILGVTDARISSPLVDNTKSLLRRYLPWGTAIIPFCTDKPISASHRNTTPPWVGNFSLFINSGRNGWVTIERTPRALRWLLGYASRTNAQYSPSSR